MDVISFQAASSFTRHAHGKLNRFRGVIESPPMSQNRSVLSNFPVFEGVPVTRSAKHTLGASLVHAPQPQGDSKQSRGRQFRDYAG